MLSPVKALRAAASHQRQKRSSDELPADSAVCCFGLLVDLFRVRGCFFDFATAGLRLADVAGFFVTGFFWPALRCLFLLRK